MKRFESGKEYASDSGIKAIKIHDRTDCFACASIKGQLGWDAPKRLKIRTDGFSEFIIDTLGAIYLANRLK